MTSVLAAIWLFATLGTLVVAINPRLAVRVEQWVRRRMVGAS